MIIIWSFPLMTYQQDPNQSVFISVEGLIRLIILTLLSLLAGSFLGGINADHLGHTLCQTVTMDKDCHRARSKFIMQSTEVRESLVFSHPFVTLKAIQSLCMDAYGAMIWDLGSSSAEQFFKCWNTCVKMVYNVPRNTFTYLVEGFLAANYVSFRIPRSPERQFHKIWSPIK